MGNHLGLLAQIFCEFKVLGKVRCKDSRETQNHILNGCPRNRTSIIQRHNQIVAILSDECSATQDTTVEWDFPYFDGPARRIPDITLRMSDGCIHVIEFSITGEREGQIEARYTKKITKYKFLEQHVTALHIIVIGYLGSNTKASLKQLTRSNLIPKERLTPMTKLIYNSLNTSNYKTYCDHIRTEE